MSIIRGSGGGKGSGGSARVSIEAADSLRSRQDARVVDLICEGEIQGLVDGLKSVYLDNLPIQNDNGSFNVNGVGFDFRNGTQAQTRMRSFAEVESEQIVGVAVTKTTSVTRTITNSLVDTARVTISVPALQEQDTTTGDISGTSVRVAIDLQSNGGGFVTTTTGLRRIDLSADSTGLSSLTNEIFNPTVKINWVGSGFAFQSIFYSVQYRVIGSGTWLTHANNSFSGSGTYVRNVDEDGRSTGGSTITPPSNTRESFIYLPENNYEFRVLKTSGTGTVTMPSGYAAENFGFTEIKGKTSSRYQKSFDLELTGDAPWDIRVRRITADSTSAALQNATFWDSFTEIQDEKFSYPNSALMALSIDSELYSKIPTRGYEIEGLIIKVPSNYNAVSKTYSGTWNGTFITAYSNNPAWIFYDLITNSRYGLGDNVPEALVDKYGLYEIGVYCDELVDNGQGGTEPRYTVNAYIQQRAEAIKLVQSLASAFAAISYWSAGSIRLNQDSPTQPTALFTPANVIDGAFSYSGSSAKTRSTVISVTWNDPDDLYRQAIEYIEDHDGIERFGYRKKDVVAFGCTSRGQAHRFGKAIMFAEKMETEIVIFSCGLDGLSISPSDVIQTSDPIRSGDRFGGRLLAATTTNFTLDADVTIDGVSVYTLWAIMPDGDVEQRTVTTGASTTSALTVSPAFSAAPEVNSVWVLGSTSVNPETWKVLSVTEDGVNAEISALEYRSDKYAAIESNILLLPIPTSNIKQIPSEPTDIVISESLFLLTKSIVGVRMSVSWLADSGSRFEVEYRREDGNWTVLNTSIPSIDIEPVTAGNYEVKVTAINEIGVKSQTSSEAVIIYGLTLLPNNVTNFGLQAAGNVATFTWDKSTDLDVLVGGYIRIKHTTNSSAPDWSNATVISEAISGNSTSATLPLISGAYLAKWVDSTGNQSEDALGIITNAPSINNMNFIEDLPETGFTGVKQNVGVVDGRLILDSANTVGEQEIIVSTWPTISAIGGIASSGTYIFDESVDLGLVQTSRLTTALSVLGIDVSSTIDTLPLIDTWPNIDGGFIDDVDAKLYVRTSTDNVTFGDYQALVVGDYLARAFEFKLVLRSFYETHNISVGSLLVTIDMPDRIASGEDIVSGAGTKSVSYPFTFRVAPALAITAQNMEAGDFYELSNKNTAGFDIVFKNSGGTAVNRTFDHITKGY